MSAVTPVASRFFWQARGVGGEPVIVKAMKKNPQVFFE
jgi:hypothetical protein